MRRMILVAMFAIAVSGCTSSSRLGAPRASASSPTALSEDADRAIKQFQIELETERALRESAEAEVRQLKARLAAETNEPEPVKIGPEFEEAVRKALEESELKIAKEREAARAEQMKAIAKQQNEKVLELLKTELSLSAEQETSISTLLADYTEATFEVVERARAAKDAGEEFDYAAEMKPVRDNYTKLVRDELTVEQQEAYDKLVGEDGLNPSRLIRPK